MINLKHGAIGIVLAIAVAAAVDGQTAHADKQFQSALHKQVVAGDLRGAIEEYRRISVRPGVSRALAAESLLRMAECYEKIGDSQAFTIYARLVEHFDDQVDIARAAGRRLASNSAARQGNASVRASLPWTAPASAWIHGKASPDGRLVPFFDETADGGFLLRDVLTGATRRLADVPQPRLPEEAEYPEGSAFSRDGRHIAYAWRIRARDIYQLRVMPLGEDSTAQPRVVFDNDDVSWVAPYDWTPDGGSIAVVLRRKDRTAAIGVLSVRTGAVRQLKSIEWDSVSNMALSPEGDLLAFDLRTPNRTRDIVVLSLDASRETTVVSYRADDTLVGWSPDGSDIVFLNDRSGTVDLWAVSVRAGRSTDDARLLRANVGRFWPVGVTPDGSVVAAMMSTGGSQLRLAELSGEPNGVGPSRVLDDFVGPTTQLSWAHDGRALASISQFVGLRPLTPLFQDLQTVRFQVHDAGTQSARQLSTPLRYVNRLDWTPDNRSLLVAGADFQSRTGIFKVDVTNGATSSVVLTPGEQTTLPPRWRAVVGGRLYYQRNIIASQIAMLVEHDLTSGTERQLLPWAPRFDEGPADPRPVRTVIGVTSDRHVVYLTKSRPAGESALRVLAVASGEDRVLMQATAPAGLAVLDRLPDGQLVVVKAGPTGSEVWRLAITGTALPTMVTQTPTDLSSVRALRAEPGALYLATYGREGEPSAFFRLSLRDNTLRASEADGAQNMWHLGANAQLSPDQRQIAYLTRFRPAARPLEVVRLETGLAGSAR